MRTKLAVLVVCAAVVVGLTIRAEKAPESYQQAEKTLNAVNNSLRNNVKNIDYPGLEKDAGTLKQSFTVMLEFWQARKADDAVKFVEDGLKAAGDLDTAAKAMNYNAVLA